MRPELFPRLIGFDEARARTLAAATPIDRVETVPLERADGRVSAADVLSPLDVPAFDRAVMDGYALIAADTVEASAEHPGRLALKGEVFTGDTPGRSIGPGTCMAIGTGAPLPQGADAVVMVEHTRRTGQDIEIRAPLSAGQNIGRRGADLRAGEALLERGQLLSPARVGALAAAGLTAVEAFAMPTVAVLSTGNEITPPGSPLPAGHVYDVNRFTVGAVVERHGGIARPMSAAGDTLDELIAALDRALGCDAIVFSGGSSVGERDLMLDALRARGEIIFHGIAVKPGKPTLLGRIGATIVFGMPGNPTSCLSNAYMLLVPFLRAMARLPAWQPRTVSAPLGRAIRSTAGRHQFYTVRLEGGQVFPAFKSSGDITSMANADGYIEIPASQDGVEAGTVVTVTMF